MPPDARSISPVNRPESSDARNIAIGVIGLAVSARFRRSGGTLCAGDVESLVPELLRVRNGLQRLKAFSNAGSGARKLRLTAPDAQGALIIWARDPI
jgi:hypothetical protein